MHLPLLVSLSLTPFGWGIQLKLSRSISYAAVAAHADQTGRRKLAAMLVEHEPLSSKQVISFCWYRT